METNCRVCGISIKGDFDRCTNVCCGKCHRRFCTSGGATEPGHNLNIQKARASLGGPSLVCNETVGGDPNTLIRLSYAIKVF